MAEPIDDLGRRERQIMDILFRRGQATAAEVQGDLPDPPSYSAVRGMLRLLEEKGHVRHEWSGPRHVSHPPRARAQAQPPAARHLLRPFSTASRAPGVPAMRGGAGEPPPAEELQRLHKLIEDPRRK